MRTRLLYMQTPTTPINDLGRIVAAALKDAGINQRDAASRTGIPLSTLSRRLGGVGKPFDVAELEALANICGLNVSDFFTRTAA